jgi:hypothetical protein
MANMTTNQRVQLHICLSDGETEPTTWNLAVTEHVTIQLRREISGISSNEQKQLKKEFSIPLMQFEAWWGTICIHVLLKKPLIHL